MGVGPLGFVFPGILGDGKGRLILVSILEVQNGSVEANGGRIEKGADTLHGLHTGDEDLVSIRQHPDCDVVTNELWSSKCKGLGKSDAMAKSAREFEVGKPTHDFTTFLSPI